MKGVKVSLILTVKNEARSIRALLDSIAAQTRMPDEVIVCDGGSSDATLDMLHAETRFDLRVVERPDANISQGRNAAIEAASGEIIASTDAGVELVPDWLMCLTAPFEDGNHDTHVVSGFFVPEAQTTFEIVLGATVLPQLRDIRPHKFLPSSRSIAFTKTAWQAVNGYPEWLDYCEDLIFDFALLEKYKTFAFAPKAIAHYRPRRSLRAFFKQYYLYARGDGKSNLWFKRHVVRYGTYLVALPGIALLNALLSPWFLLLYLLGAAFYTRTPYRRLWPKMETLTLVDKLKAIVLVPVIRLTGDVAKMVGYPVGVWWRLKHRSRHP